MFTRHTLAAAALASLAALASTARAHDNDHDWAPFELDARAASFHGVEQLDHDARPGHDHDRGHEHGHGHHGPQRKPFQVKIIGFNDYHGNLLSPGSFGVNTSVPVAQRPAVGGADYLAGYVSALKRQNPLNVVVGAGDFIGASPLVSALFFDEPAVETLNKIGVEFNAVGNHEFDKGAAELRRLQRGGCHVTHGVPDPNSCKGLGSRRPGRFDGARFQWLSANVVETATGRTLLPAVGIKRFNGVPVAFIGMTLKGTPSIVTPSGVAGLQFRDEADTVNALVPRLRARGVEAIVVLVHQGGFQGPGLSDINGCDGNLAGSDIAAVVSRLDNAVDLVVSGHTHAAYNCSANTVDVSNGGATVTPRVAGLPNIIGRLVPVTSASAFGRVLTDIDVTLDPRSRDIVAVSPTNRLVDRSNTAITPSAEVAAVVTGYNNLVSPIAGRVIGTTTAGNITYGEAFTVQPFGNSLVTMTLTAQDLKNVLEQQFAGCRGQGAATTRLMLPSAGLRYTWDGAQACDARIRNLTLTLNRQTETIVDANGTVLNPARTYRVTVNNFMATGGDGYTTFLNGTDLVGGAQDIDALVAYLAGFKSPNAPYDPADPALGKPRLQRVGGSSCPSGVNVNP